MNLSNYDTIYLLSNIFGTYVIYRFMGIFFAQRRTNKNVERASYMLYFMIIGSIYITYNIPIINLFTNLILFFLLTFNYWSTWKLRLIAVVYIYAVLIAVEVITIVILKQLNLNMLTQRIDIEMILALIISKILSYMVVLVYSNFKMSKEQINISALHWGAVFIIPLGTLFSTFILMTENDEYMFLQILISIVILFLINIFVFYLYDALLKSYQEKLEAKLLKQENNAYIKQMQIITQAQENIKTFRHDIKNHMSSLQALIEKDNKKEALQYLQDIFETINYEDQYANSGNMEIDSILNYKIHEAKKQDVQTSLRLQIPEKLSIQPFDLVVIIGNLLDNAIEATSKLKQNKKIEVSIRLDKGVLYVRIINSFDGKVLYKGNKLKTLHTDKENHGLGLNSVQKAIKKYNGTINIRHKDNVFYVDVLLYTSDKGIF